MEMAGAEGSLESASHTTDSGLGDRGPQLGVPTYVNATPSGEVQIRIPAGLERSQGVTATSMDDVAGRGESGEQPRTAGRGLMRENLIHGVHPGTSNRPATTYGTDLQSRMYPSQIQRPGGMEAPRMSRHYFSQVEGTRYGMAPSYDGEDAYGRYALGAAAVDQGEGFPRGQVRGRRDAPYPEPDAYYGTPEVIPDTYNPVAGSRHHGGSNGPRYRKPATYDGKTDWQDYSVQFEIVAELNQWDEKTKAMELATNLRGVAQGVLSDLRPEYRMSYRHLVHALQSRFEPTNQSELYRAQIKNRIRKKGEALTELSQDVKRLVRLAYPEAPSAVREHLARDCFIDALNDSELEWAVFQGKASTVEDAVRIGLEYEAFDVGHRRKTAVKAPIRMQQDVGGADAGSDHDMTTEMLHDVIGRLARMETETTPKPSWEGPNVGRRRPGHCHHCEQEGHWKMECPNLKYGGQNQQNSGPNRQYGGQNQQNSGPNRQYGGQNQQNSGPNRQYGGQNQQNSGPNRQYGGQNQQNSGPNRQYGGQNQQNSGPNRQYAGQNQQNSGPNRQYGGPNQQNNGPSRDNNSQMQSRFPPTSRQTNRPVSEN
jgi:hypothetical protein